MELINNWVFLGPYFIKAVVSALAIGVLGLLIGKFCVWHEPEDFE